MVLSKLNYFSTFKLMKDNFLTAMKFIITHSEKLYLNLVIRLVSVVITL